MPADSPKRFNIWTPLTFSVILISGILIGFQLNKYLFNKRSIINTADRNDRLEEIIDVINAKYVDTVSTDSLYEDAISGILKHLDPHTVYIPARELASVTESLEGNFQGIGVEFHILNDTLMVTSVLKNGPSADAGVLPGDKIIKINDSTVAGININSDDIISKLRGLEGSDVNIKLLRTSEHKYLDVNVKRGTIPIFSLDAAYMIDAETGYIRINRFSATTYREFMKALNALNKAGMKKMILDLRDNPGGYLDAATAIADELIGGEKLLVYTQGRASEKEEYLSGQKGKFEHGALVVLVDEGSASASEVLSGAIQDWDRGIIVGRRSYGKGLVQQQFDMGDGSALRLTIARYYTPSGRSIQRPYTNGKDAYEHDFEDRFTNGSLTSADTLMPTDTVKYFTNTLHRTVYGGGGIKPDIVVPYETNRFAGELYDLLSSEVLPNTIYEYFALHSTEFAAFKTFGQFDKSFKINNALLKTLKAAFSDKYAMQSSKVWKEASAMAILENNIKATFARMLFRTNGYYQEINKDDNVVQRALRIIRSNEYSAIMGRNGL